MRGLRSYIGRVNGYGSTYVIVQLIEDCLSCTDPDW